MSIPLLVTSDLAFATKVVDDQAAKLKVIQDTIDAKCECSECQDLLSLNDKVAVTSVFVASPAIFTGMMSVAYTGSLAVLSAGSFGVSAIAGAGFYFGYRWLMKNYRAEEDMKKALFVEASRRHGIILNEIKAHIHRIQVANEQLASAGTVLVDDVPVNYRENECPICLEMLIVDDISPSDTESDITVRVVNSHGTASARRLQPSLERLPCGHILHQDCYTSLIQSNVTDISPKCPFCRAPLLPKIDPLVVLPVLMPGYNPQTAFQFVKSILKKALKETVDFLKIAAIVAADVAGTTLVVAGGGFVILWIPTAIPMLAFISMNTGSFGFAIKSVVCSLGLAGTAIAGGMSLCSFAVKNGLYSTDKVALK